MKIRTQYDKRDRYYSDPGSPIKVQKKLNYKKNGEMCLIDNGKINLYNEIQSHADSVDIHVVLQRFANGDTSMLRQGVFGDFTNMPTTFAGVLQTIEDAKTTFAGLPVEIRKNFDFDFNKFIATMDNPKLFNDLCQVAEKSSEPVKDNIGQPNGSENAEK